MDDSLVRAVRVERTFRTGETDVAAVRAATFEIHERDRIALVGPSGSGKTTILHLIAALDEPSAGSIDWPAIGPANGLRPGPVAVAFQGPSLLPPLTVAENVELPAILSGAHGPERPAAGRTVAELLDLFEVSELAEKLPEEISGGQAQRVGLARAFVGRPL